VNRDDRIESVSKLDAFPQRLTGVELSSPGGYRADSNLSRFVNTYGIRIEGLGGETRELAPGRTRVAGASNQRVVHRMVRDLRIDQSKKIRTYIWNRESGIAQGGTIFEIESREDAGRVRRIVDLKIIS
jgi:hypothetical protein